MYFCHISSGNNFVSFEKFSHESESLGPLRGNLGIISFSEKTKGLPSIYFTSLSFSKKLKQIQQVLVYHNNNKKIPQTQLYFFKIICV